MGVGDHAAEVTFGIRPCHRAGADLLHDSWCECGRCRYFVELFAGSQWRSLGKDLHDRLEGFARRDEDGVLRSRYRFLHGTYIRVLVVWIPADVGGGGTDGADGGEQAGFDLAEEVFIVDTRGGTGEFTLRPPGRGNGGEPPHVMATVAGPVRRPTEPEWKWLRLREALSH